jgi:hypothetical protein
MVFGILAQQELGVRLPLQVLEGASGFYVGTADDEGPCSRESVEYWPSRDAAEMALQHGDFTQRQCS